MKAWIVGVSLVLFSLGNGQIEASIIKRPPVKTEDYAYKDIPITEEQKAIIYEIISTVGETAKIKLAFKQDYLRGLGEQISEVHPLKFLETIFANDYLKKTCMLLIWNDYFKRSNFLDGLCPALDRETEKGKLMAHIEEFGKAVGVPGHTMQRFFEQKEWENLVLHLIQS